MNGRGATASLVHRFLKKIVDEEGYVKTVDKTDVVYLGGSGHVASTRFWGVEVIDEKG